MHRVHKHERKATTATSALLTATNLPKLTIPSKLVVVVPTNALLFWISESHQHG
uniref:Uncharacterized protein n=1 Tax=Kalanchoe fedtschenkoi TaxID=63787 RepID=A0A7N0VCD8_KALFE